MQLDTTITLTRSELIELVRKAYPEIKSIYEVRVVEDTLLGMLNKRTEVESNSWIDVPKDWKNTFCPTLFKGSECIDIVFRHGRQKDEVFPSEYILAWRQDGHACDIVKYRLSRKSQF